MVKVVARRYIKPECREQLKPLYDKLLKMSRGHKGCIEYDLYIGIDDDTLYMIVETWENEDALKAHGADPDFLALVAEMNQYRLDEGKEIIALRTF